MTLIRIRMRQWDGWFVEMRMVMLLSFGHQGFFRRAFLVSGMSLALWATPVPTASTVAITRRNVFQEPLVPVGGMPSEGENQALSQALDTYLAQGDPQAVGPLTEFLDARPASHWRASILSNLGWVYRQSGMTGRALRAWREAWRLSKSTSDGQGRALADWSVGCLADLTGRLGKHDDLEALLQEARQRSLSGPAATLVDLASQQLAYMDQDPAHTFRCGPEALAHLAEALGQRQALGRFDELRASSRGTSLAQLQRWGRNLGIDIVGIRLKFREPVPVPSLLYLKEGHFATVVRQEGSRFRNVSTTLRQKAA